MAHPTRKRWILAFIGLTTVGVIANCATVPPVNVPQSDPTGVLVEYQRQGGIAGWDDRLVLQENGHVTLNRRSAEYTFDLDPQVLDQLLEQLRRSAFSTLEPEYLPTDTCCDLIEYTVTYRGHTVQTMDTAVPDSLQSVLGLLDEIVQSSTKS